MPSHLLRAVYLHGHTPHQHVFQRLNVCTRTAPHFHGCGHAITVPLAWYHWRRLRYEQYAAFYTFCTCYAARLATSHYTASHLVLPPTHLPAAAWRATRTFLRFFTFATHLQFTATNDGTSNAAHATLNIRDTCCRPFLDADADVLTGGARRTPAADYFAAFVGRHNVRATAAASSKRVQALKLFTGSCTARVDSSVYNAVGLDEH